ncbi:tyrosine-type recombinase/integrase [Desulfosporosinus nitroreducens]|uniref:tyrosine-type recombinase/integrase n=1 Tax=Desulfosporosinus nitroreducens TaxID=2018668 RepID=UPI00207CDA4F|nr:tyrosine-type recombinase/integrase [Desulfosporosinus nitroreducens]MCO1603185.1 tyrosine-type recombinase/integrase [Desulfosporosinus nitroreducens]
MREVITLFKKHLIINERSPETLRAYMIELENFAQYNETQYNGPVYLEEVTVRDIEEYLHELKVRGSHASRRSRMVYILRSFYNFATRQELVNNNVAARVDSVKVQQLERTFLSDEEFQELVSVITNDLIKVLIYTLFMTGLRIKEALDLTLQDVDFTANVIRVKHGKGNKSRVIPIGDKLLPILRNYVDKSRPNCESSNFFATKVSGQLSASMANKTLKQTVSQLGWNKKVTCHVLRHSFASHLVRNNVNIVRVQKLLGHASLKTTSIYTHATMDELAEAVNTF